MVLDSIKSVFALMALIASGFYFAGKPWFGKQGMDFLSKFTVEATIPFYMFYNIYKDVGTRESLISLVSKLPVTFGLILLCLALAALMGVLLKVDGKRRYTFVAASGFPNVVFIGFPVIQALWGQGDHLHRRDLLYRQHTAVLDRGDLAPEKGWEVRGGQRGERTGRIKEAGVPADHRHGPWHGGSIF